MLLGVYFGSLYLNPILFNAQIKRKLYDYSPDSINLLRVRVPHTIYTVGTNLKLLVQTCPFSAAASPVAAASSTSAGE